MNQIALHNVLPRVFKAEEASIEGNSQVWLQPNLCFEKGRYYMVEAASGAGKSSLCSFIYGLRSDYLGQIAFDGVDIRTLGTSHWCKLRRESLAILPQDLRLFPELTVMENIQLKNSLCSRLPEAEIMAMLAELEIDNKASALASHLSIGQQQRVALVRALCQPFDFLLLDEPVSHLDVRNNRIAASLVHRHAEKQRAAIIATSVGNPLLIDAPTISISL